MSVMLVNRWAYVSTIRCPYEDEDIIEMATHDDHIRHGIASILNDYL